MHSAASWGIQPIRGRFIHNEHLQIGATITVNGGDPYARYGTGVMDNNEQYMSVYFLPQEEQMSNHFHLFSKLYFVLRAEDQDIGVRLWSDER